ncbi:thiamine phosphate synthase [Candidatus Kirkpatrickella diaphorinae]|uniref:Thiamine-phosphate synthase n=1 Tax=Candidatus Kirkpatrickella diaphorinae TaxID=2984322 RepID=A0ABY6GKK4_9PROT|nr:thiamine phosphate synthase [Candidatus Kirkpatrickella diaphorinae]UYH51990.1 thiamine phosphate synthase [Candidatus Kirkpatrickella diaphorinae]
MTSELPSFYLILDTTEHIEACLKVGLRLVQMRIKDRPLSVIREEIAHAKHLCDAYGAILVVNDYWQMACELGCGWVHLGQEDLDHADLTQIRRAGLRIGLSTHNDAELTRALALTPDYIALGPIYETKLKEMKCAPQGLGKIRVWKDRISPLPLIAIGGLTPERLPGVLKAGADVACVVTDVITAPDPVARCRLWLERTSEAQHVAL